MMSSPFSVPGSPINLPVLHFVADALRRHETVWLCTVLQTFGSSPRPAGTMLALTASGEWAGSVSGGCIEMNLISSLVQSDASGAPVQRFHYGLTHADQQQFKLPCGGQIDLLVERLVASDAHLAHVDSIVFGLQQRQTVGREVRLDGGPCQALADWRGPGIYSDGERIRHVLGPVSRLLLIGAGEVARQLARLAIALDFAVTLCDPRDTWITGWDEPGVELSRQLPDDLIRERFTDEHVAIVALAHDPRVDDMALMQALVSPAFFVGAMGSPKTSAARRERLHTLGLSRDQISRLKAPVGFLIGSKTPVEIAVAIAAQLVAERHRLLARVAPRRPIGAGRDEATLTPG